jgi:phage terminase large subunit
MWNVYGLGLRSTPEGLVFQYVDWIEESEYPVNVDKQMFGMDFGSVDPTAVVQGCVIGKDLYLRKLMYEPTDNQDYIAEKLESLGIKSSMVFGDSAAAGTISYLRKRGFKIFPVVKPAGSITYGIQLLKNYRLHIVRCPEWEREQLSYKHRVVNGIKQENDYVGADHLWDAARYLAMSNLVRI